METAKITQGYWQNPVGDVVNSPVLYMGGLEKSEFIVNHFLGKYPREYSICELGCNCGRNLMCLKSIGFANIIGFDINPDAIKCGHAVDPDLKIYCSRLEDILPTMKDNSLDVVFTMAVLAHIHPDSDFIFKEMARITRKAIVTMDDEKTENWFHYSRNYRTVFEGLGLKQVAEISCYNVPGLNDKYIAREFIK